jgi:S-DNA-T family DNA segregation ATPase FtsK/SpoIIIE
VTAPEKEKRRDLQPLVEDWLKDWALFRARVGNALHRAGHRSAWHGLRLPLYLLRLIGYSPRGLWRALVAVFDVVVDAEFRPLRVEAVAGRDVSTALDLRRERNERIHVRLVRATTFGAVPLFVLLWAVSVETVCLVVAVCVLIAILRIKLDLTHLVAALAAGGAVAFGGPFVLPTLPLPPTWVLVLLALGVVLALGWVGRPIGKRFAPAATVAGTTVEPLRAPFVMEALVNLGVRGMTKVEDIKLLFDVARVGPGFQVDLELPAGVEAAEVMERRGKLSAALRRELGCVWPSVGPRHEGHLVLYVADQPMSTAKQSPWPLLKDGRVDLFRPVAAFTDQRNRWVEIVLAFTAWVIGAVPRMGKTFAVRELLLIAGLDPRAKVYAFDLKGTGDLGPCALYAHGYGVGADEEEEIAEQLQHMREIRQELRRRTKVVRRLPRDICPESKVTSDLASMKTFTLPSGEVLKMDLGPIVVGVDECQMWFEEWHDKAVREEFIGIARDLVKRGPALGIVPIFATQKPDAKSIPSAIAANASARLCFKVNGQVSNDQVLGTSSYKDGVRATVFAFADKGIAYFRGDGADARIVRTVAGLDAPTAEKVAARARALRVAAGTLTGFAAGEVAEHEAEQVSLLQDVRQVVGAAPVMHLGDIREGLAGLRPALYGHLDNAALGSALRDAGVQVANVYVAGKAREESTNKGVKREWLDVSTTEALGPDAEAALLTDDDHEGGGAVVDLRERRAGQDRGSR